MKHLKLSLVMAALSLHSAASADALLNLIESSSLQTDSVNRVISFVELADGVMKDGKFTRTREREYSVPYLPDKMVTNYAADVMFNWKKYQDSIHWAQTVNLNNDLSATGSPTDLYFPSCTLPFIGEASASIAHGLLGTGWLSVDEEKKQVNLAPLLDPYGMPSNHDRINAENHMVPRVKSNNYCVGMFPDLYPDEGIQAILGLPTVVPEPFQTYEPGHTWCSAIGCVSNNSFAFNPLPAWTDWSKLAERMDNACNNINNNAYKNYQKEVLLSLGKNMPTAIHWDGVAALKGDRSGTTMAPFYSTSTGNAQQVLEIGKKNALFPGYVYSGLPSGTPDVLAKLDDLKRELPAGFLQEQEIQGAATFFQTWQKFDTFIDPRPVPYYVKSYFTYISILPPGKTTSLYATFPLTMVPSNVTATKCTTPRLGVNSVPGYGGLTTYTTWRYHYGATTVSESRTVPNVTGNPTLRVDSE
ncbi:hypothetical protein [Deinococcus ficus]|uniref:Uncharacterized protein n=1 Tax=Deinococcus ficus TaxID=317577 RepID=A0A221T344_9DEIO|nr:hypothetical protein [Deinococcus ficus]ASN83291.1 hypothetical protein DFI_19020 [Deinococcus ficus]